jgi:hypothetical protein
MVTHPFAFFLSCKKAVALAIWLVSAVIGLTVPGQVFGKKLECDKAAKVGILGLEDHTHTTAAQLLEDAVLRDRRANHAREASEG